MPELRELSYREITRRLYKLGFRFYCQGKGSHELWVRDADGRVVPVPCHHGKNIRKGIVQAIIREVSVSVAEFRVLRWMLEEDRSPETEDRLSSPSSSPVSRHWPKQGEAQE